MGLLLLLLLASSFHEVRTVHALAWSAPAKITPSLSIETKPYAVEDSQGILWVVYESLRSSNFDIYGRKWDGSAWSAEEWLTSHSSADQNPAIAQLSNGTMILVWASNRLGGYSLFSKRLNSGVWSAETQLTFGPGTDSTPTLLQSRSGTLWVFWTRQTVSGTNVNYDVYFKTYANGVWTPDTPLANSTATEFQQSVFEADNGTIWALYASDKPGNFDLYYKTSTGTWSAETRVTTNGDDDRQAWIMQDLNGTIWMFWARCVGTGQTCQDDIFYKASSSLGASWSPETQYTFDPPGVEIEDSEPAAVNARDKRIYLFWSTNITGDGGDYDVYYSRSDPIPIHDLVVLSPTMAQYKPRRGEVYTSTVRVYNGGDYPDTASLTVEIDGSMIGSPQVLLQPGQTASYTYNTDTSEEALGPHDLNVSAVIVPGEARMANNQVSSKFYVLSPGDVQRDGLVNVVDLASIGASFGSTAGRTTFNPEADLNHDGRLDVLDLATTGAQFGQQVVLPPDFDLASSNYYPKLVKGSSSGVTITVRSVSGFSSPVTLGATTTAPGVTVSIRSSQVVPPGTSALVLTASLTAVPGNFPVTVTGSNATVSKSISLSLQVASAEFTMSPSPTALTIARGGSGQNIIITLDYLGMQGDVNRDGTVNVIDLTRVGIAFGSTFGSPNYDPSADINQDGTVNVVDLTIVGSNFGKTNLVMLAVTGLPSGVSGTLTPTSLNPPGTATLTLTASPSAVTGTFTVTITGTSAMSSQSVTIVLTVT